MLISSFQKSMQSLKRTFSKHGIIIFLSFTFTKDACEWRRSVIIKYNTKIRIYIQALHRIVPLLSKATVVPISIYSHEGVS